MADQDQGNRDWFEVSNNGKFIVLKQEAFDDPDKFQVVMDEIGTHRDAKNIKFDFDRLDPETISKLGSIIPTNISKLILYGTGQGLDVDLRQHGGFDLLDELVVSTPNRSIEPYEFDNLVVPPCVSKVTLCNVTDIRNYDAPTGTRTDGLYSENPIGKVRNVPITTIPGNILGDTNIAEFKQTFPTLEGISYYIEKSNTENVERVMPVDDYRSAMGRFTDLDNSPTISCSRAEFERMVILGNTENGLVDRPVDKYLFKNGKVIDTTQFPHIDVQDFNIDALGDSKFATIMIDDASQLSTYQATELLRKANEKGIDLGVEVKDARDRSYITAPYNMEDYVACSREMDRMITQATIEAGPGATERQKFARAHEQVAGNRVYDYSVINDPEQRILRCNSSRNLMGAITGECVCAGYAMIEYNMAKRMGLEAYYDEGHTYYITDQADDGELTAGQTSDGRYIKDGSHAWVRVKTDGVWTMSDPTWDSDNIRMGKVPKYFAFTEAEGKMAGRISYYDSDPDIPRCTEKISREEISGLYSRYNNSDFLRFSDAELYNMSQEFEQLTGVAPTEEQFRVPDPIDLQQVQEQTAIAQVQESFIDRVRKSFRKIIDQVKESLGIENKNTENIGHESPSGLNSNLVAREDSVPGRIELPNTLDQYKVLDFKHPKSVLGKEMPSPMDFLPGHKHGEGLVSWNKEDDDSR